MAAEPLLLLLGGEPGGGLATPGSQLEVGGGELGGVAVEDDVEVAHQLLHHERLVGVVHQRREGHLGVRLPRLHQRGAEDDAQVAGRHLVLLRLLRHPGGMGGGGGGGGVILG